MEEIGKKYSEVIQDSIHSIVCIDDHYVDVYEDIMNIKKYEKDYDDSKKMFRALSTNDGCQVTLVRFSEEKRIEYILRNQDLLILDWKLYDNADRPEKTLEILNAAVLADIPYVCIYTKDNIADILPICAHFFSGTTHEELQYMFEASEMLSKPNIEMLKASNFYKPSDITEEIISQLKNELDQAGIDSSKKELLYKLFLARKTDKVDGKYLVNGDASYVCDNCNTDKNVLCVKNTVIFFMQKDQVTAEQVLDKITEAVKEVVENTIVNIIWLNYSNQFKKALRRRNSFLQNVSPEAFAYCVKKLSISQSDLESFVRELYRQELDDLVMAYDIEIPEELKKSLFSKIRNIEQEKLCDQLITINSRIMINHVLSNIKHNIQLGDMFCSGDNEYWLCITALCDSARPKEDLDNDYLFLKGHLYSDKKDAIKTAESRWDSYVEIDNKTIIIEWNRKIKSLYIEQMIIERHGLIEGQFRNKSIKLKYIGTLKEKYVQRIANRAFSDADRIGVSLANTRKIKYNYSKIEGNSVTVEIESGKSEIIQIKDKGLLNGIKGRTSKEIYWDPTGWS